MLLMDNRRLKVRIDVLGDLVGSKMTAQGDCALPTMIIGLAQHVWFTH